MKFLRMEWTKKRGIIALLATAGIVSSFILGGYVATGNWNPWGNRHYYQVLNANFQECYTPVGGTTQCQSAHNVMFNNSTRYVEQVVQKGTGGLCAVGAGCSFNFIAMCGSTCNSAAPTAAAAGEGSIGTTAAWTSGACGAQGGTNTGAGSELTTNGFAAAAGTVTDIPLAASPQNSKVVITFTDATAATAVSQSCLVNESTVDVNRVNLAAASFTAITLQIGDTIQITWTITWTWS